MPIPKVFPLGTRVDPSRLASGKGPTAESVVLGLEDLQVHALLAGSSGSGKSRAATALALDAFDQHVPIVVIDKHGDTAEDIAAHVAAAAMRCDPAGTVARLKRLHFL